MESRILQFAESCSQVGSLGYGEQWDMEVATFLNDVPFQELLKALETEDASRLDMVCMMLKHILNSSAGSRAMLSNEDFVPSLIRGLGHASPKVRKLSCFQIRKIGVSQFSKDQGEALVKALGTAIHDAETGIAISASEALSEHSKINRRGVLEALKTSQQSPSNNGGDKADISVVHLRILHLVAKIAARDEESFQECHSLGVLDPLVELVGGSDILLQLNALKIIPLISATNKGLELLLESRVVAELGQMAGLADGENPPDPFLGDEALRVMSVLSARSTNNVSLSKMFLQAMVIRLKQATPSTLEMIGAYAGAQPPDSLNTILKEYHDSILLRWMELACQAKEKVRAAGLASIASALRGGAILRDDNPSVHHQSSDDAEFATLVEESMVTPSAEDRAKAAEQGKELFLAYGSALNERLKTLVGVNSVTEVVKILMELLAHPLDEQKCAVYSLLRVVAAQDHDWGLRAIYSSGCEVEKHLMDRSIEMSKQAREWRFSVLEAVFHSPHRDSVLGEARLDMLKKFLRKGPYAGPSEQPIPQIDVLL